MKIVSKIGNEALMQREKTAFVCSRKTPDGLEYAVAQWLLGLSAGRDCVICGNQSPVERAVFTSLLDRKIPTILALAEAMPSRFDTDVDTALREGRLLVITHCDASVHSVTARSAFDRNVLMLSLAKKIIVGHCTEGGRLERALAGFDNVERLSENIQLCQTKTEAVQTVVDSGAGQGEMEGWSRKLKLAKGFVFLDFNDSGVETYFKITHSIKLYGGEYSRERLFFSRKELASFCDAVRLVDSRLAVGEPVPSGLEVESLSGNITFAVSRQGLGTLVSIVQNKVYGNGQCRISTVSLEDKELSLLLKGVEEALAEWKRRK